MRYFKAYFFILFFSSFACDCCAQFYSMTGEVLHETKYLRKKQSANSVKDAYIENESLVIHFNATLSKRSGNQPYRLQLNVDSVLSYLEDKTYNYYGFDSAFAKQYHVRSIKRCYSNISNKKNADGIEIMCGKEIVVPEFPDTSTSSKTFGTVGILSGEEHPFEWDHKKGIYIRGQHVVFLFYFKEPKMIKGKMIDYLVINVENGGAIKKINYLKLPYTLLADTVIFPFALIMSGSEK